MRSFGTLLAGALCAAALGSASAAGAATTLFSDLGPGQSYGGGGLLVDSGLSPAESFVAAASGSMRDIDVALALLGGSVDSATVSLWTDGGGKLGVELGSWTVSGFPNYGSFSSGHLATTPGDAGIGLTAGDTYYLKVASSGLVVWLNNTQGATSTILENGHVGLNQTTGAFDVGVPEPATWAMMILGVAMIGFAARRRCGMALAA